jgi:hypothetical protein
MADPTGYYDNLTYGGNPFAGAKLKIKRSERHLIELTNAARELPRRRNYNFVIGTEPQSGKLQITCMTINNTPLELAGVVGDAIHNIRSVFDHVTVVITCPPFGGGDPENTKLPVGENLEKFIFARDGRPAAGSKRAITGKMKGAGPDALRIVKELKPYYGGDDTLRALHDLDIIDKHKLIIPTISVIHVEGMRVIFGDKVIALNGTDFHPNVNGSNFTATIDMPSGINANEVKFDDTFEATFTIAFGKIVYRKRVSVLSNQPIIPTLTKLLYLAKGFVNTCEAHFL